MEASQGASDTLSDAPVTSDTTHHDGGHHLSL